MRMLCRLMLFFVLIALPGCVFITLPGVEPLAEKTVAGKGDDKIVLIDISGIIKDGDTGSLLGMRSKPNLTARIREELDLAAADRKVKAVVLRINTPGGSVTTSDVIAHELERFKEKKKVPVVAHLMDMATSGGYYIAASADRIIAQPTAVTGSIGVIAFSVNASGLMDKIGITNQTIKSGDLKDIGSPLRPMTEEDRKILQSVIDSMYDRFLDRIMEGRPGRFTRDELKAFADGRIFTARQAMEYKLVDSIGYLDDAIEAARKDAGIKEARVVTYSEPRSYKNNIYSKSGLTEGDVLPKGLLVNIDAGRLTDSGMQFMYIWLP